MINVGDTIKVSESIKDIHKLSPVAGKIAIVTELSSEEIKVNEYLATYGESFEGFTPVRFQGKTYYVENEYIISATE